MLNVISFEIEGIAPLLMHNGRLSDPLDQYTQALKEVSAKRQKTDSDHVEMARIEWEGGIYWSDDIGLYVPGLNLEAALQNAAAKLKLKKVFKSAVVCEDAAIAHAGPKTFEDLRADPRFRDRRGVKVSNSRVMRTRPKVPLPWSVKFDVQYDDEQVNAQQVAQVVDITGRQIGLGDYVPKYGRFEVANGKG